MATIQDAETAAANIKRVKYNKSPGVRKALGLPDLR